jgi:hypothetical protein
VSCDPALVQEAAVQHLRFMHPKYREAERVAQAILEEYLACVMLSSSLWASILVFKKEGWKWSKSIQQTVLIQGPDPRVNEPSRNFFINIFSIIVSMKLGFDINELINVTKSVDKFGELKVLIKLANLGYDVVWHGSKKSFDILVNRSKEIEVKSCNYDNRWAKRDNAIGGWDRINPKKFDFLVCVSFNKDFKDIRYFIFTSEEAEQFSNTKWKNAVGLKNLILIRNNLESEELVRISEDKWDKIK